MYIKRSHNIKDIRTVLRSTLAMAEQSDEEAIPDAMVHDLVHYVLVYSDKDEVVGCYTLIPHNEVAVDIHTNFLPKGYGEIARGAIPLISHYIFETVGWKKALTEVPSCNRLAHKYVKQTKMKHEGTLSQAFLKNNVLYDILVYGMTEGEYKCQ